MECQIRKVLWQEFLWHVHIEIMVLKVCSMVSYILGILPDGKRWWKKMNLNFVTTSSENTMPTAGVLKHPNSHLKHLSEVLANMIMLYMIFISFQLEFRRLVVKCPSCITPCSSQIIPGNSHHSGQEVYHWVGLSIRCKQIWLEHSQVPEPAVQMFGWKQKSPHFGEDFSPC